jgi:hypothetical protein
LNPKERAKMLQDSNVPESVKQEAHQDAKDHHRRTQAATEANIPPVIGEEGEAELQKIESPVAQREGQPRGPEGLTLIDSNEEHVPFHSVRQTLAEHREGQEKETAAQRRRRLGAEQVQASPQAVKDEEGESNDETPAERRRRLGALKGSTSPAASQARRPMSPSQQPLAMGLKAKRQPSASVVSVLWESVEMILQSLTLKASLRLVIRWRLVVVRTRRQQSRIWRLLGLRAFDSPISLASPLRMNVLPKTQDGKRRPRHRRRASSAASRGAGRRPGKNRGVVYPVGKFWPASNVGLRYLRGIA